MKPHASSPALLDEKPVSESSSSSAIEWDSPEYANIPQLVRDVVGFEDDPGMPTLTFRPSCSLRNRATSIVHASHRVGFQVEADRFLSFRTTSASFSVFFIVLVSWPLGKMMEQVLPNYQIPLGRFSFSLNPGPFSAKEHVLIGIAGNAGSKGNWASNYNLDMNHAVAFFFGWAASIVGFAFTALVRQVLIYDPAFIFPVSLQQVTLYRTIHKGTDTQAKRQMQGFWGICVAVFVWQYIFSMTAALAPVCWFGGHNKHCVPTPLKAASFVGSGMGGMGVLNITLDVSNLTSAIITRPFFVQVVLFVGSVITMWILVPIAYFGNKWGSPTFSVMSNGLFTKNGSAYPFNTLLTPDGQLNQTRYDEVGLAYAGAQYLWFIAYAAFISSFVWMALFAGPQILAVVKSMFTGQRVHRDRLSWWISIFITAVVVLLAIVLKGHVYMPLFTLFVALAMGAVTTLPMSIVYAISGYQVDVGYFNELVYGYMLLSPGASRHPLGQLAYRIISGNVWYDARDLIEDQKIGHCFVRGIKTDPNGQWTGQDLKTYNTAGIQYALVGPQNLFADARYKPLWYGFGLLRVGAVAPLFVWNTTIFFSNMSKFILSVVWNFYLYRYRKSFWKVWAYITGAARGFNLNLIIIFVSLGMAGIAMPTWWGNNAISVERCFGKSHK
ncbi:OPT oligopeptide transporter [Mycena olivaceomarginata]|nr:OPT oligopeptide transporter [Mycena olivaceomarginata]